MKDTSFSRHSIRQAWQTQCLLSASYKRRDCLGTITRVEESHNLLLLLISNFSLKYFFPSPIFKPAYTNANFNWIYFHFIYWNIKWLYTNIYRSLHAFEIAIY